MQGKGQKMMKRFICLALAVIICIAAFTACEKKNGTVEEEKPEEKTQEKEETKVEKIEVDFSQKHIDKFTDIKDKITVFGRSPIDEKGLLTSWSNSGFEVSGYFSGTLKVYYSMITPGIHYHTTVDGKGDNFITIADDMNYFVAARFDKPGYHTVSVYKSEEATTNYFYLTAIEYKGMLDDKPLPKTMNIEIIGDSISCGTGLNAPNGLTHDAFYSYGSILGRDLNANVSVVAVSGWGLSCGITDYNKVVPKIYDETAHFTEHTEKWDFENNKADVVIVNLGTNDYTKYANSDRTELYDNANAFFDKLRSYYPDAYILFTYGMMSRIFIDDFKKIVAERNDPKLEYFEVDADTSGWGSHPDYNAHAQYAKLFGIRINELTKAFELKKEVNKIRSEREAMLG